MAREIKFRCWDKKTKTIKNVMSISFKKEEVIIEPMLTDVMYEFFKTDDTFTGGYVRQMGDVVLMEFTGLYDKNGKEIYEGDIVNLAHKDTHPKMRRKPLVVRFDEKNACFIVGDSLALSNVLEIIGNIHDNPELLEETK